MSLFGYYTGYITSLIGWIGNSDISNVYVPCVNYCKLSHMLSWEGAVTHKSCIEAFLYTIISKRKKRKKRF